MEVAISGAGLVTPAGLTVEQTWQSAVQRRSTVRELSDAQASAESFLVAQVEGFEPDRRITSSKASKFFLREDFLGTHACLAAADAAGLSPATHDLQQGGLFVASGKDEIHAQLITEGMRACMEDGRVTPRLLGLKGLQQFHPFSLLETMPNTSLFAMSSILGISGTGLCLVGTGDTGARAIGEAARAVAGGECTYALTGAQDSRLDPFMLLALRREGLLAPSAGNPAQAMRPFDRQRQGFALGEGAAFVVLETVEAARKRGAHVMAKILGYGMGNDSADVDSGMRGAIQSALDEAAVDAANVDVVFAWGDCTGDGDQREAQSIHEVFGPRAGSLPVTCLKPITGNMLGASAAAEVILAMTALQRGLVPPTLNHASPDSGCGLGGISASPLRKDIRTALCLARGFHGQNVALLLGQASP